MSSSTIQSLQVAQKQVIIYFGSLILILGLIGDFLNIIVFISLRTFRQSSCAFYLTIMSIVNIGQLITGLLTRIMIGGFNINWTQISLFYCKFRIFFFQLTSFISFACMCLATIDQYFATCTHLRWQQWSNIKIARRVLLVVICLLIIEQIPGIFYYGHIYLPGAQDVTCTLANALYMQLNTYFDYLILGNILPYLITFTFGLMAYRNIQQIAHRAVPLVRRELDKQLTVMVLVQIVCNFLTLLPNLIVYIIASYGNIQNRAQINFISIITVCFYYLYFAIPFYIYISVSERFRRQLIYVIFRVPYNQCRKNRIHPEQPIILS